MSQVYSVQVTVEDVGKFNFLIEKEEDSPMSVVTDLAVETVKSLAKKQLEDEEKVSIVTKKVSQVKPVIVIPSGMKPIILGKEA